MDPAMRGRGVGVAGARPHQLTGHLPAPPAGICMHRLDRVRMAWDRFWNRCGGAIGHSRVR
jgi:hypothetical protein